LECTLENSHGKKSEHIRSQSGKRSNQNVKQHVLGASKNGQTRKSEKGTEKKQKFLSLSEFNF